MASEIYTKIREDIKTAMKAKDSARVSCLRLLDSEIQNEALKARKEIADDMAIEALSRGIKQREDALEIFKKASRDDLVEANAYEISVYKTYLPAPLTETELSQIIDKAISESGATSIKQVGKVMGKVIPLTKGKADSKVVNKMVQEKLTKESSCL